MLKSGIDLKGLSRGYVVVPPSLHRDGGRYTWEASSRLGEVLIAEPPDWMVQRLQEQSRRSVFTVQKHIKAIDPDSFILGKVFKGLDFLGRQIRHGVFAVRCPNEHHHSCGKPYDSSTVPFAPSPGARERRGTFYCSHNSFCTDHWR